MGLRPGKKETAYHTFPKIDGSFCSFYRLVILEETMNRRRCVGLVEADEHCGRQDQPRTQLCAPSHHAYIDDSRAEWLGGSRLINVYVGLGRRQDAGGNAASEPGTARAVRCANWLSSDPFGLRWLGTAKAVPSILFFYLCSVSRAAVKARSFWTCSPVAGRSIPLPTK